MNLYWSVTERWERNAKTVQRWDWEKIMQEEINDLV